MNSAPPGVLQRYDVVQKRQRVTQEATRLTLLIPAPLLNVACTANLFSVEVASRRIIICMQILKSAHNVIISDGFGSTRARKIVTPKSSVCSRAEALPRPRSPSPAAHWVRRGRSAFRRISKAVGSETVFHGAGPAVFMPVKSFPKSYPTFFVWSTRTYISAGRK